MKYAARELSIDEDIASGGKHVRLKAVINDREKLLVRVAFALASFHGRVCDLKAQFYFRLELVRNGLRRDTTRNPNPTELFICGRAQVRGAHDKRCTLSGRLVSDESTNNEKEEY